MRHSRHSSSMIIELKASAGLSNLFFKDVRAVDTILPNIDIEIFYSIWYRPDAMIQIAYHANQPFWHV